MNLSVSCTIRDHFHHLSQRRHLSLLAWEGAQVDQRVICGELGLRLHDCGSALVLYEALAQDGKILREVHNEVEVVHSEARAHGQGEHWSVIDEHRLNLQV